MYPRIKSTRVTSSADVKAIGGPAYLHKILVMNNGTAGTAGNVEVRDAVSPAGDGGTLRFDLRFGSVDEDDPAGLPHNRDGVNFFVPLYMPNGIRITLNTVTNVVVWVFWEG